MRLFFLSIFSCLFLYLLSGSIITLRVHEENIISKQKEKQIVEFNGILFKNSSYLNIFKHRKLIKKYYHEIFLEFPELLVQFFAAIIAGLLGGIIRACYNFSLNVVEKKWGNLLLLSCMSGTLVFFILLIFPSLITKGEIVHSNLTITGLSLLGGIFPVKMLDFIRNKLDVLWGKNEE